MRSGRAYRWTPPQRDFATPRPGPRLSQTGCSDADNLAAVQRIQRWWRRTQQRQRVQIRKARNWWRISCDLLELDKAAQRIQGGFHMWRLRARHCRARASATRLQAYWKGMSVRSAMAMLRWAARRLQQWYRTQCTLLQLRARVRRLLSERHRAAVEIQTRWRTVVARRLHGAELERQRRAKHMQKMALRKVQLVVKRHGLLPVARHTVPVPVRKTVSTARNGRRSGGVLGSASAMQETRETRGSSAAAPTGIANQAAELRLQRPLKCLGLSQPDGNMALQPVSSLTQQASQTHRVAAAIATGGSVINASKLVRSLLGRGVLSCGPRAPLWPQEKPGMSDLDVVKSWLDKALPQCEVQAVYRVNCNGAIAAAYNGVRRTLGPERLLWHGTPWESISNIVQNGFNRAYVGRHGTRLGRGTYFAEDAKYALRFCGKSPSRAVVLAGVLPGHLCKGEEGLVEPPLVGTSGARYDSTVDDPEQPRIFCVFRDYQALPLYVAELG